MPLRTSVKAARTAIVTGAGSAALRTIDKMSPTTKDVTSNKWMENPNDPGNYTLMPFHEQVITPGMSLPDALASAAPTALRDATLLTGVYLGAKGIQKLNRNLSPRIKWFKKK